MAADDARARSIESLVTETRTAREALHGLVMQLRRERPLWERDVFALARRTRLTAAQRQQLRERLSSHPPPR